VIKMNFKNLKPYHSFFIVAFLILLIGIKSLYEDTTLDINVHDTYYIISHFHIAILLCVLYFFQGFFYWIVQKLMKRKLVSWLTAVHTFILIGSFIYYWMFVAYYEFLAEPINLLFDDYSEKTNMTLTILTLLIFFIAVPAFIINLIIGVFRKADR